MNELFDATSDFLSQPFGAVGAACIMLAVTVINSQALRSRLGMMDRTIGHAFNGLNLVGGTCLFINAVQRSEVVWLVLEVYFVAIAVKGIAQSIKTVEHESPGDAPHETERSSAELLPT